MSPALNDSDEPATHAAADVPGGASGIEGDERDTDCLCDQAPYGCAGAAIGLPADDAATLLQRQHIEDWFAQAVGHDPSSQRASWVETELSTLAMAPDSTTITFRGDSAYATRGDGEGADTLVILVIGSYLVAGEVRLGPLLSAVATRQARWHAEELAERGVDVDPGSIEPQPGLWVDSRVAVARRVAALTPGTAVVHRASGEGVVQSVTSVRTSGTRHDAPLVTVRRPDGTTYGCVLGGGYSPLAPVGGW